MHIEFLRNVGEHVCVYIYMLHIYICIYGCPVWKTIHKTARALAAHVLLLASLRLNPKRYGGYLKSCLTLGTYTLGVMELYSSGKESCRSFVIISMLLPSFVCADLISVWEGLHAAGCGPPTAAKHGIWGSAFISRFAALVFTKWFGNMEILGARTDTFS